jgi:3-hydroxymyristoyl/3-hydroxydecanoyl-(acyl carrier protein) dehydratase
MIAAELCLPAWSPFFEGHFEGAPILSGVAQLALVELLLRRGSTPRSLRRIERVRFKSTAGPGDVLRIELGEPDPGGRLRFRVERAGAVVSEGVLGVL